MTQPRLLGGRYELDGVIGRGGMAEVYRARDVRLDRVVAVKTLREDLARDATFQARFRREAQSAASLNNPSIVAVYDTGEDTTDGAHVPYIVMEYVDGRTLRELLRDDRRLLPERALEITEGVLRALDYSHRNGIIHRDIKPGNVMLTRSGQVKVMDFGIARAMSDSQATMTQTAQVIGTAQYLSPEQARGERVDSRSDLYSTGCLLYELLTGRPPFTGDSPVAIAYQHVREHPVPPSQVDADVPPWADSIVLRAMAKDPNARYQTAADMAADIRRALSGMPVAAPPPTASYGATTQRIGAATAMAGPVTGAMPGYEYGPESTGSQPPRGRRGREAALWILGLLVVLGVVGGVAYYILGSGSGKAVPFVSGLGLKAAESSINAHGLQYTLHGETSTTKKGFVISTSPSGGAVISPSQKVTINYSLGPGDVTMPKVTGEPVAQAENQLSKLGLKVTTTTDQNSAASPSTVIRQRPAPQASVPKGSTVTLTVSPGGTQIPSVINDTYPQAVAALNGAGFDNVHAIFRSVPGAPNDVVIAQNPRALSMASPETRIVLKVVKNQAPSSPSPSPSSPSPSAPASPSPSATPPSPTHVSRRHGLGGRTGLAGR